jgi:hypothetical protein
MRRRRDWVSLWERAPARECWQVPLVTFGRRGGLPQGQGVWCFVREGIGFLWERAPARECWPEPLHTFGRRGGLPQGHGIEGFVGASPCSRMRMVVSG